MNSSSPLTSVRTSFVARRGYLSAPSRGLLSTSSLCRLVGIMAIFSDKLFAQQPAVLGTTLSSNQIVIFADANNPAAQTLVPGLPLDAHPHGVSYFDSDHVLVADAFNSRIFVVKVSTASLTATIDMAEAGYDGTGTLAVSPDGSAALAMGGSGP